MKKLFVALFPIGLVALIACASVPDENRVTPILQPDYQQFDQGFVSYFLERRCGTLDCHGQVGRPLRIYGRYGLRLLNDAGLTPITGDTTEAERAANYRAVVGLEPEEMSRVVSGEDSPESLLIILKPLGDEEDSRGVRHKGGSLISRGDAFGYECLTRWLSSPSSAKKFDADAAKACQSAGDRY